VYFLCFIVGFLLFFRYVVFICPQIDIVPLGKVKVMLYKWKIKRKKVANAGGDNYIYVKKACILAEVAHNLNLII
jgi:hypothetical protein